MHFEPTEVKPARKMDGDILCAVYDKKNAK